ncbi:type II secretion system ATPase GspE [Denitratisoma oestradiolicum]|uniref:Type II secretion system protein E n=1 Tax=Denitratisoma oestradiolicum TaxID=311182 RepID=A0A6S6Y0D6_9PROT|nr:type II secretion system ATPase GspE [Denitratisoma oestradiolicum]TWO79195.1 type II secretion system protein GspE [Denitratisoma oestradiolicum]CAB1370838.1 general secretory pathway component, cryptic [Denitratisoma oestradiolicum]
MTAPSSRPISYSQAKTWGVLPLPGRDGWRVLLRPGAHPSALAELRRLLGGPLDAEALDAERFDALLASTYAEGSGASMMDDLGDTRDWARLVEDVRQVEDLLDAADDAPIIRMINGLLLAALKEGASDIHFEPFEQRSLTRIRVDGVLRDLAQPPRALHAAIVSRLKIMAGLDIAEKRLPQDGRIALRLAGRLVDVRLSTLPSGHGERVVLRLLDKEAGRLDLATLGLGAATQAAVDQLIRQPHGILLVTGPTGSGKTTTLYAALSRLDAGQLNIMTVEDPIEYDLDGIGQTQVNPRIELDFARALRAILRQDPDVVMIGEIRDLETAQIAVQASLTGHLVLATLHTNDAVSAVTRLADMGIEPFLLGSSLLGVLAQRLVRRLCPDCRSLYAPSAAEWAQAGSGERPATLWRAVGCPACKGSGYQGRSGIYELMQVDDELRRLIHDQSGEPTLRSAARTGGMLNLKEDALRWVMQGETSLEEILRVTRS